MAVSCIITRGKFQTILDYHEENVLTEGDGDLLLGPRGVGSRNFEDLS